MTADRVIAGLVGPTSGTAAARDAAQQYWAVMARTADLVRNLTALADRYDANGATDDARADERRSSVALMRATAESGRRLIRSLALPALPFEEQPAPSAQERADQARRRDVQALERDAAAEARDQRAKNRDLRVRRVAADEDVDWAGRFLAACDRDDAAGDRADARADRRAAQVDRESREPSGPPALESQARTYALVTRLEECAIVRQAQGMLMQRAGLTAGEAFEALLLACTGEMTLKGVCEQVVHQGELPAELGVS